MYFAAVILLMLVLPAVCVGAEVIRSPHTTPVIFLIEKWFVFWAVGVRIFGAGVSKLIRPQFTAGAIFGIQDRGSYPIVREVGFGNLSIGLLGICSMFHVSWVVPAAIVGGTFYGLAGLGHASQKNKNAKEYAAMISDGFAFLVLLILVIDSLS
jgi:hypothetical protein